MSSKSSYRMGFVVAGDVSWAALPHSVTYNLHPVRDRTAEMDAFAGHIHGNKAFSLDSVAKAVEEAFAKYEAAKP